MQDKLYDLMKSGERLCAKSVSKKFTTTKQHASRQLVRTCKSYSDIDSEYKQEIIGNRIYSVKYYFFKV